MPKLLIMHPVEDVERWLKGKAERVHGFELFGGNVVNHVAVDGSPKVFVSADIHDMDGLKALMDAPPAEVAALMQKHGVLPPAITYIEA